MTLVLNVLGLTLLAALVWLSVRGEVRDNDRSRRGRHSREDR
jgi:hypothetical protein